MTQDLLYQVRASRYGERVVLPPLPATDAARRAHELWSAGYRPVSVTELATGRVIEVGTSVAIDEET